MAAHPGLRTSNAPPRKFLAHAQQSSEQHESVSSRAENQTGNAAAADPIVERPSAEKIDQPGEHQQCRCPNDPRTMGTIKAQSCFAPVYFLSISPNCSPVTRWAASCGQAYTQAGVFRS